MAAFRTPAKTCSARALPRPAPVLVERHVPHAVKPVLYAPVVPRELQQVGRARPRAGQTRDRVDDLHALAAADPSHALDPAHLLQPRPVRVPFEYARGLDPAELDPAVPLGDRIRRVDLRQALTLFPGGKTGRRRRP
jgi:hypothetical protein